MVNPKSIYSISYHILSDATILLVNQKKNIIQQKRGIITLLVTGFIGLAYKGISSYFHII